VHILLRLCFQTQLKLAISVDELLSYLICLPDTHYVKENRTSWNINWFDLFHNYEVSTFHTSDYKVTKKKYSSLILIFLTVLVASFWISTHFLSSLSPACKLQTRDSTTLTFLYKSPCYRCSVSSKISLSFWKRKKAGDWKQSVGGNMTPKRD
jgi:hypothetical protein